MNNQLAECQIQNRAPFLRQHGLTMSYKPSTNIHVEDSAFVIKRKDVEVGHIQILDGAVYGGYTKFAASLDVITCPEGSPHKQDCECGIAQGTERLTVEAAITDLLALETEASQ